MHQNSIIYRTYGGIGIGQKFAAECGIKHKFVAEWRNGRPRKMPPSRHGNLVAEITKMAKTCFKLVQIDSYLDTS